MAEKENNKNKETEKNIDIKNNKKTTKPNKTNSNKKSKTILEVNEITEETIKEEEAKKAKKEEKAKELADKLRKEKFEKTWKKIFKDKDINYVVRVLMWIFFTIVSLYVNITILRQIFSAPSLKIFVSEESLKKASSYTIDSMDNISINLESFDINIRESENDEVAIKYSKKFDKKINVEKKNKNLLIEEKKKVFKILKFDTADNVLVVEIPKEYAGTLEAESKTGAVKLEKYKILNETEKVEDSQKEDFYKNFFNI